MKINVELILECLNELHSTALTKQKYADYYNGQHAILKNYAMQESRSNQKLIFNFPRKFVDNEVGYLLGKPVNYVSKSDQDEAIHNIDVHMSHWDKEHNLQLRKQSEIFGESFELNYIDSDGQFSATVLSPLKAFVLEDGTAERNVLLGLHKFTKRFDKQVYLDVYTDHEILHYTIDSDDKGNPIKQNQAPELKYIGKHNHIFGRVPLISCPANTERKSGFHDVISLFDAYNALNSDLVMKLQIIATPIS
ncbi:UNVERIFIED_CONTAM: SPP1 family phage portal protein [Paenibacillus sp. PvR008]